MNDLTTAEQKAIEQKAGKMTGALTGSQMADLIGADPKDFRRFVRAIMRADGQGDALPGSGRRYAFTADTAVAWAVAYRAGTAAKGRAPIAGPPVSTPDADSTPDV